jgi:hypothetical protein
VVETSWKDKRIAAINRLSKIKGWSCSDNNPYFDLVQNIYKTKAKSLKQFKEEQLWISINGKSVAVTKRPILFLQHCAMKKKEILQE